MLDANLIATLEKTLQKTRNAQVRLMSRLREVEHESERLREEIQALENSAAQTESAIDGLLVAMRSGSRSMGAIKSMSIEDVIDTTQKAPSTSQKTLGNMTSAQEDQTSAPTFTPKRSGTVAYFNQRRGVPSKDAN